MISESRLFNPSLTGMRPGRAFRTVVSARSTEALFTNKQMSHIKITYRDLFGITLQFDIPKGCEVHHKTDTNVPAVFGDGNQRLEIFSGEISVKHFLADAILLVLIQTNQACPTTIPRGPLTQITKIELPTFVDAADFPPALGLA